MTVKMSREYARTLEEDKRERFMEREMGISHKIPVEHQLVVIVDDDGQWKWIEAQPLSHFAKAVFEAIAFIGMLAATALFLTVILI